MIALSTTFGETFVINISINEFHEQLTRIKSDHIMITPMNQTLEHNLDDIILLKKSINHVWIYESNKAD